jgi:NAD(P)-dependent dehydrogenase (short-subunit alcohol dehydrogenase family)
VARRSALVTGGSRGIGAAIADRLGRDGFDLTLVARKAEALQRTADEIRARHHVRVRTVVANLAVEDDVRRVVPDHRAEFAGLDVLVLNAGVGAIEPLAEATSRMYHRLIDVNLRAPMLLIQDALPILRSSAAREPRFGAKIIALSSITGVVSEVGHGMYGATKAALTSICETVSVEESLVGVTATAISPGYVDTDMAEWKRGELEEGAMLRADDVAEIAMAITRLSAGAIIPNIVLSRKGDRVWRA